MINHITLSRRQRQFAFEDKSMTKVFVSFIIGIITLFSNTVQATVVEYSLEDPFQYEREIGPIEVTHSSPIDIYVANVYNENRWKDWKIIIWVPVSSDNLAMNLSRLRRGLFDLSA